MGDHLEAKYMHEVTSSKKSLVSNFNNYKMVDNISIMEQFVEIERFLNHYNQYNLDMDEAIIDTFLP